MASNIAFLPKTRKVLSLWDVPETLIESEDMSRPLYRICELMRKQDAKSIAIHHGVHNEPYFERIYVHLVEYLGDIQNIADVLNVIQVVFFSRLLTSEEKKRFPKTLKNADVLGTCVIVSLQFKKAVGHVRVGETVKFVYEAVVRFPGAVAATREPRSLPNNYYHVFSGIQFWIAGKTFSLPSSYFCQSDGVEAACSQASLRMTLFHSEPPLTKLPSYRTMNNVVREARKKNPMLKAKVFNPFEGYYISDIQAILRSQGMKPLILDCKRNLSISPYEWAYLLVESGIPTLIVFSPFLRGADKDSHVIPVVGHTTNYDEWLPPAYSFYEHFEGFSLFGERRTYISSSSWASHLIVQDDLLGPYHCLGARDLVAINRKGNRTRLRSRIQFVIGVVPEGSGFTISPYVAQDIAAYCFRRKWREFLDCIDNPWRTRFRQKTGPLAHRKSLVLRTQLISCEDYLDHLSKSQDYVRNKAELSSANIKKLSRALPDRFWMTEFTCPQLYSVNRAKFGEVLTKFAPSKQERKSFGTKDLSPIYVGLRFINHLLLPQAHIKVNLGFQSHIGLFRRVKAAIEY